MSSRKNGILVTGDVAVDEYYLVSKSEAGFADEGPNWKSYKSFTAASMKGGAWLLSYFLQKLLPEGARVIEPTASGPVQALAEKAVNSHTALKLYEPKNKAVEQEKRYYIKEFLGYSAGPDGGGMGVKTPVDAAGCGLVVIDDAGNVFRHVKSWFPKHIGRDCLIVYKMSSPLCRGECWQWLKKANQEKVIVVLNAKDLRKMKEVQISKSLSWERTALDCLANILMNESLSELREIANLVVVFGTDGALLYHGTEKGVTRLIYDPKKLEEDYEKENSGREVMGRRSIFTAALSAAIYKNGLEALEEGVKDGLSKTRDFISLGYRFEKGRVNIPDGLFAAARPHEFGTVTVPKPRRLNEPDPCFWTILEQKTKNTAYLAAKSIVETGKYEALKAIPEIEFEKLRVIDRSEIESFSSIRNLIREYLSGMNPQPLSIAVFGAPGSGKSFGITQIAESLTKQNKQVKIEPVSFNLSQFKDEKDLVNAFHKVRDLNLGGKLPLVFFDEFDSFRGSAKMGWLKSFLSPMQDAKFFFEGVEYPIGRAIFIFAGGTCENYETFTSNMCTTKAKDAKQPDFVSRLRGFINISGVNPAQADCALTGTPDECAPEDCSFLIKRAKILRLQFEMAAKARGLFDPKGKKLNIDEGVLRALLRVFKYKHGIRSINAIIQMSRLSNSKIFDKAALPPAEQLLLHVDTGSFKMHMEREAYTLSKNDEDKLVEELSRACHENYITTRKNAGAPVTLPEKYDKLSKELKESNKRLVSFFPNKLAKLGYGIRYASKDKLYRTPFLTENDIYEIARMEHESWCLEKKLLDFSYGDKKDIVYRKTPYLKGFDKLSKETRKSNQEDIVNLVVTLIKKGFEIYRTQEKEMIDDPMYIEIFANEIHEDYLNNRIKDGVKMGSRPAMNPFDKLPEDMKYSNYDNAYHIPTKLLAAGYGLRHIRKHQKAVIPKFTKKELDIMSRLEHDRWVWERRLHGWVLGDEDPQKKITPCLIPFDELPADTKLKDRQTVALIPFILKKAGYEIYKL